VSVIDNEKLRTHITATANRLRMIQADFADHSDEMRREYLHEEIERVLKTILPDERVEFLEGLKSRFPVAADIGSQPIVQVQETDGRSMVARDRLNDPEFLVQLLVKIFPTLSDDVKKSVVAGLQRGQIQLQDSRDYSDDGAGLEPGRVGALTEILIDFVNKLEPLVWSTWRKLSPRSSIRPAGDIKNTVSKFACADGDVAKQQVENELRELQQIITAMITAVSQAGDRFAKHHLSTFSPSEISALVRLERKGVLVSHEVKCWRKYQELASTLTEATIEADIRKAIAEYAESLMKVGQRS
jgi:hypothetical protein